MSDLYNQFFQASWYLAPVFAFFIGAAGSLHCVGMCGGISLVCSSKKSDVGLYSLGRLVGYLSLVVFFAILGNVFLKGEAKRALTVIGGGICAIFMLYIGLSGLRGREPKFHVPWLEKVYRKSFGRFAKARFGRAFGFGLSSMLLPCALSNGFVLAAISFAGPAPAMALVVFFWAGTLPAMIAGPQLAHKAAKRFNINGRKVTGALFVVVGIAALTAKIMAAWELGLIC